MINHVNIALLLAITGVAAMYLFQEIRESCVVDFLRVFVGDFW